MNRIIFYVLVIGMALALLAACQSATPEPVSQEPEAGTGAEQSESAAAQGEKLKYVLLVGNAGNEFWALTWAGIEDVVKGLDLPIEVEGPLGPSEWNGELQLTAMDQVIASRPDVIILTANDSRILVPGIERAVDAGIVVQGFDVQALTPLEDFVGTSFVEMGEVMGRRVLELCEDDVASKGECKVGITELTGQEFTTLRKQGFHSVIDSHPEIKIAGEADDKNNPEITTQVAGQMLAGNPDIRVLMSFHGQGAVALASAVKAAGLTPGEDVYVIGNDLGTTTLDCIESGDCDGTVTQDPYMMGVYSVINSYLRVNKITERTLFEGKYGLPWINSGTSYLQKEDLAYLKARVEEIQAAYANR